MSYTHKEEKYTPNANDERPERMPVVLPFIETELAKKLLGLRKDILAGEQHRGANFEIVHAAYTAVRAHYGHVATSPTACKSGCIVQMNKILTNWFKEFDRQGGVLPGDKGDLAAARESVGVSKDGKLQTLSDREIELGKKTWKELVALLGEEKFAILKGERRQVPKKDIIAEHIKL